MKYQDIKKFKYDKNSKFTEEILVTDSITKSLYDIYFDASKKCNEGDLVKNSSICRSCYYREFLKKIVETKRSKRKDFIDYQLSIRSHKDKFISEIHDFIIDNSQYFEDYNAEEDYINILENINSNEFEIEQTKDEKMLLDIFISHASKDVEIIKILIEILQLAFKVEDEKIRCTSVPGFKLKSGDNVDTALLNDIKSSRLILGLMSQNSIESPYVLFEIGASWGANKSPMLIAKNKGVFSLLPKPLSNFHHTSLDENSEIHELLMEIKKRIGYNHYSPARVESKISDLVNQCKMDGSTINDNIEENKPENYKTERLILNYAKTTEDGTIRVINTTNGTTIQIDQSVIISSDIHRDIIPYLEALEILVQDGYLKKSASGERYSYTSKAYNL